MAETCWQRFKRWMNSVPDCNECGGTGVSPRGYNAWRYWHGQRMWSCMHCGGAGKL